VEQASKVVLFGALVGGVSMMSYATETTIGPTIEKAQLETVDINLDEVVAAITKADSDWVKRLPVSGKVKAHATQTTFYFQYIGGDTNAEYIDPGNWTYLSGGNPTSNPCSGLPQMVCVLQTSDLATGSVPSLISYLTQPGVDAAAYCQDLDNMAWRKPNQ